MDTIKRRTTYEIVTFVGYTSISRAYVSRDVALEFLHMEVERKVWALNGERRADVTHGHTMLRLIIRRETPGASVNPFNRWNLED